MMTVSAPTTRSQDDTSNIEGRFAACCDWFGLEVQHFTYRPDNPEAVLLTADLLDWGLA